ncbi:MAG: HAD-IC family P-type ATPase [Bacilli bacterium]
MNWHAKSIEKIYEELDSSEEGLTDLEKSNRILKYGLNIMPEKFEITIGKIFLSQFINPIIYILVFAAIFSLIIGEYIDTLFIAIVVIIDVILGTYQEWQAEKSADSLKNIMKIKAKVIRNSKEIDVDSQDLTIGDIILLKSGDKVPADIRIITCYNLTIDESFLTGESVASIKNMEIISENTLITDRKNICYAGSKVMTGRAKGIVVAVGVNSEMGKIVDKIETIDETKSPLVIRMAKFTKQLSILTAIFILLLIIILYFKGYVLKEIFFLVVALSVSAIPEGLPIVLTVTLSIATKRMAKRNVIVRKLNSVEGLGSCTIIASDKTGTLTLNEQTAKIVMLADNSVYNVTGQGYNGVGQVIPVNLEAQYKDSIMALEDLVKNCIINNEASLEFKNNIWINSGDAIDVAFLSLEKKIEITKNYKLLGRIPYESEKRYSAAFYEEKNNYYVTIKGSIEKVLEFCTNIDKEIVKFKNDDLSKKGYRVIAVAKAKIKEFQEKIGYEDKDIPNLDFIGLVGFIDPIREESKIALNKCLKSGIKVVMITGDSPLTANKIAKDLGLINKPEQLCTGEELNENLKKGEKIFDKFIENKLVFSRVNPLQKLDIIKAYKRKNEFVAVTGDGVNDAPALIGANIGIAMGSGTDVAKDSSSIIITDDNFLSIVAGIEEGRHAYNNIRKVTYLLVSCCLAEVLFFLLSIVFNYPIPLLAVQLLWLNLITEGIQDIALAFEKGEINIMNDKPRKTSESLFDKLLIQETVISGVAISLIAFIVWIFLLDVAKFEIIFARSYMMLLMVFLQNVHVFNCRSELNSTFKIPLKNNKFVVWSVVFTLMFQIIVSQTSILNDVLKICKVQPLHIIYLFLMAIPLLIIMEIFKKRKRRIIKCVKRRIEV